ncbi:MAG: hypothetical protein O9262_01975 [Cyclobacteriaceae bacterium]|nr:hypothetical protein [Cyclobacteriaceae bacterium]
MELLESDDPKTQLLRKAQQQKDALHGEVKVLSERTEKVVKTALIVGGTLAATYLLYKLLSDNSSSKKKKKIKIVQAASHDAHDDEEVVVTPSPFSGIINKLGVVLATQASAFLLSLAKEKIGEYMEKKEAQRDKDADNL